MTEQQLPKAPTRELPCTACRSVTTHTLTKSLTGCDWVCGACKHVLLSYSHDDMRRALFAAFGSLPAPPKPTTKVPTKGVKVFLDHGNGGELELHPRFVEEHVEITGKLPEVGGQMFTRAKGLPPALAMVPYGKVLRVETP